MDQIADAEERRQNLQQQLDARRSRGDRNRSGQFATPPDLAVQIATFVTNLVDRYEPITFLEPSLGSGAFYYGLLRAFGKDQIKDAVGIEFDNEFATLAKEVWSPHGLQVMHADFFDIVQSNALGLQPSVLLANPPYTRHHHLTAKDKQRLQQLTLSRTGIEVSGLAGMYVHFFLLAMSLLRNNGIGAWLIPSGFMDVNYGAALRDYLTREVTTIRIHRFDPTDVQFGDALVTSSVVVVKRTPPPNGWQVEITYGGDMAAPKVANCVSIKTLRGREKWSIFANGQKYLKTRSATTHITLGDLFRIQRGIATGANDFFIMRREDAAVRGIPNKFLKPILPPPRHLTATIIGAENDGYPTLEQQLVVFDSDISQRTIEEEYPDVWKFLTSEAAKAIRARYLIMKRSPWYRQEQRQPAPYMLTYMGRSKDLAKPFRFIWNQSDAIGSNLYLLLYPRKPLAEFLDRHLNRREAIFNMLDGITSGMLKESGRVYGGGLHKMEPRELASIPLTGVVDDFPVLGKYYQQDLFEESVILGSH